MFADEPREGLRVLRRAARMLSGLVPALIIACGSNEPNRTISELTLSIDNQQLVVGEQAHGTVTAMTTDGCFFESPCRLSISVALRATGQGVVQLSRNSVMTYEDFTVTALKSGTSTVWAEVQRRGASQTVTVLAVPAARE
jgi:hypothetical protein